MSELIDLVNKQAEDEGLWFVARTAPEAYLQQHLRELHTAVEADTGRIKELEDALRDIAMGVYTEQTIKRIAKQALGEENDTI